MGFEEDMELKWFCDGGWVVGVDMRDALLSVFS